MKREGFFLHTGSRHSSRIIWKELIAEYTQINICCYIYCTNSIFPLRIRLLDTKPSGSSPWADEEKNFFKRPLLLAFQELSHITDINCLTNHSLKNSQSHTKQLSSKWLIAALMTAKSLPAAPNSTLLEWIPTPSLRTWVLLDCLTRSISQLSDTLHGNMFPIPQICM